MFIDTHSHTNFSAFKGDYREAIQRALDNNIWIINVGSQMSTSERAVKIAEEYQEGVYAVVGLHPYHLFDMEVEEQEVHFRSREEMFDKDFYRTLARFSQKVVGIGESGLDYSHLPGADVEKQKKLEREAFIGHVELAHELNLPLVVHARGTKEDPDGSYQEIVDILRSFPKVCGVAHCFTASTEIAKKFLDLGFYISFTGIITFKNAKALQEVVEYVPLDRMLSETDAPYLAPEPHRGKRNEPLYVKYVVEKIAELKLLSSFEVEQRLFQNARDLFTGLSTFNF